MPVAGDARAVVTVHDRVFGNCRFDLPRDLGDTVVRRADGLFAYQLVVTVDDLLMGVDDIVRGRDLLRSAALQLYIRERLLDAGFGDSSDGGVAAAHRDIRFAHLPLIDNAAGRRLAKRERSLDMGTLRKHGVTAHRVIGYCAWLLGLQQEPEPCAAADLLHGFSWDALAADSQDRSIPDDPFSASPPRLASLDTPPAGATPEVPGFSSRFALIRGHTNIWCSKTDREHMMTAYMDHKDLTNESIDETRATQILDGVHRVLDAIAEAESAAGRAPGSVKLLAATKTRDVGEIMAAIDAGVRMIGENRPQEVMAKAEGLRRLCADRGFALGTGDGDTTRPSDAEHIPFHLIGQLQANKIGKILPDVNTIESVDGVELAQRIARRAVARGITVGVLLEVNESGEASKSGCDPQAAVDIAAQIAQLDGIRLEGLMTIGAHVDDEATIRACFAHLRGTRDTILASRAPGTEHCTELSMGMTHDMALAIAEGATIVRVGTAIFGERAFI